MRIENTSEFKRIRKIALDAGWDVCQTAKGHWKFTSPNQSVPPVVMSGSPGDREYVFRHYKPRLRSAGLDV